MKKTTKIILLVVCVATLLVGAVAGTYAWLVASTAPVKNTFTFGNINITLTETKGMNTDGGVGQQYEFKILPGKTVDKDPTVTVEANSEKCYLFVQITKENDFDEYISYSVDSNWFELAGNDGVYYRVVNASATDQSFNILTGNKVTVMETLKKSDIDEAVAAGKLPSMSFVAYAVQFEGFEAGGDVAAGAALAWAAVPGNL